MSKIASRADWADDEEFDDPTALPPPQVIHNEDGTRTETSYHFNDRGQKVKTTRKIKTTIVKERVNPRVAERKQWEKFGDEKGRPAGPQSDTTTLGEDIQFRLSTNYKAHSQEDKGDTDKMKAQLKDKKVKCRICNGEHFTARCPFKDTMAPVDEAPKEGIDEDVAIGAIGSTSKSYVPPHLRGAAASGGDRMSGKYERDDLATLRVTNVSEFAEEQDLRDMFSRFGHVTRVFLARDRETGRAKGFAFISFADRADAAKACEKMDGFGYGHLILRVEFAKRST
ncbi:MAG: translation initiation factor eIF3 subunit g [Cirrosporium novae-zelandiae]|nr:MAG: translation initiation factor eIF3 subunit g [Cirrosporium novae-zelandiae]